MDWPLSTDSPILRGPQIADEPFKLAGPRRPVKPANDASRSQASSTLASVRGTHEGNDAGLEVDRNEDAQTVPEQETPKAAGYLAGHDSGYKEGYKEGYECGLSAGEEEGRLSGESEGRAAYTAGLQQLEQLAQSLNQTVEQSLDEAEEMMVSIVFESVCKIIGDALATREGIVSVVQEALRRTRGKSALVIRVNPLDLDLIEESAAFGIASEADWRADETVPMGGCIVESEYGTLDARIETQLNQLKRTLLATHHKPGGEIGGD